MAAVKKAGGLFGHGIRKWAYNLSGFNKYGLHADDCLYENEDVKKAISRLPPKLQDERIFRHVRAFQLSLTKSYLPKEQWTKYEEDNKYLQPYLQEVIKERLEREAYDRES